jgi:RNA polymerase sigma factor (sigma-70 family)
MNPKVLIVDDDAVIVDGLTSLLLLEDIASAGAFDRMSALAMIRGTFYPVIVADVRLHTEQQGLELLEDIRNVSPNSRVLSLTGYSTPELEHELRLRGSTATIAKPASGTEIIDAITTLLAEVERLAAIGDDAAVERLHGEVRKILYSIAKGRYRLDAAEAEDAVQDAWLLYLEKRSGVQNAAAWLAGTVANLCRRQIGSSVRARDTFIHFERIESVADTTTREPDGALALQQALRCLDPETRNVCELIAVQGHAYEEVSRLTGLPLGSVGPLYLRAKKKMRLATSPGEAC